jgi:hypothetical protein
MRLVALAIGVLLLSPAASQAPASLAGCLTDPLSQAIPAGWITVTGPSAERRVVADARGCYRVGDLPPGTYTVRAAVPGFCDGIRKAVSLASGERVTVNFTLVVAPLAEGVGWVWTGWPDVARRADSIVYLQVEDVLGTEAWPSTGCASEICTEIQARVISVVRPGTAARVAPGRIRFLRTSSFPQPVKILFRGGDEFVAFLQWVPAAGRLMLTDAGLMVPVRDGRLAWVVGNDRSSDGRKVADFLAELRALPAR